MSFSTAKPFSKQEQCLHSMERSLSNTSLYTMRAMFLSHISLYTLRAMSLSHISLSTQWGQCLSHTYLSLTHYISLHNEGNISLHTEGNVSLTHYTSLYTQLGQCLSHTYLSLSTQWGQYLSHTYLSLSLHTHTMRVMPLSTRTMWLFLFTSTWPAWQVPVITREPMIYIVSTQGWSWKTLSRNKCWKKNTRLATRVATYMMKTTTIQDWLNPVSATASASQFLFLIQRFPFWSSSFLYFLFILFYFLFYLYLYC